MSDATQRLQALLGDGCYFPRELPPQFTTAEFSKLAAEMVATQEWDILKLAPPCRGLLGDNRLGFKTEIFSAPKSGMNRRQLSLVNPVPHLHLAGLIAGGWDEIQAHLQGTECSAHTPQIGGNAPPQLFNQPEFERRKIDISAQHDNVVSADILRFYNALYTHAIAWALHGKDECKKMLRDGEKKGALLGDLLDRGVRLGQESQSVGIPVGPYTSRIISEIVGVAMDAELKRDKHRAVRHVDDWHIGVMPSETPQKVIADIASACQKFGLDLNHAKTKTLISAGEFVTPAWLADISFFGRYDKKRAANCIRNFFAKAFDAAKMNPDASVLAYAVKIAGGWDVCSDAWELFEGCLLAAARSDPRALDRVVRVFAKNPHSVNRKRMSALVNDIIRVNAPLGRHFEVSWALSLAKELDEVDITEEAAREVCKMNSSICALLLLDLRSDGHVCGKELNTREWRSYMNPNGLHSHMWLLVYEARMRDWLSADEKGDGEDEQVESFFKDSPVFRALWENKVSFYSEKRSVGSLRDDSEDTPY